MISHYVIPDIHADIDRLLWSLKQRAVGSFVFLGDIIDAGKQNSDPQDSEVLETIRSLVEKNKAQCIMGNHELNAILFHRRSMVDGRPLRERSVKNFQQHKSFVDFFGVETDASLAWTNWMLENLPLWIECKEFRAVHACWSNEAIKIIKQRRSNGFLKAEDLEEISLRKTLFAKAVETIISGPELKLPPGYSFLDTGGNRREFIRFAWWQSTDASWKSAALSVPNSDCLPTEQMPENLRNEIYATENKPVFFGHYKIAGHPVLLSHNATSLDFPERACLYRFSGEQHLHSDSLIVQ